MPFEKICINQKKNQKLKEKQKIFVGISVRKINNGLFEELNSTGTL